MGWDKRDKRERNSSFGSSIVFITPYLTIWWVFPGCHTYGKASSHIHINDVIFSINTHITQSVILICQSPTTAANNRGFILHILHQHHITLSSIALILFQTRIDPEFGGKPGRSWHPQALHGLADSTNPEHIECVGAGKIWPCAIFVFVPTNLTNSPFNILDPNIKMHLKIMTKQSSLLLMAVFYVLEQSLIFSLCITYRKLYMHSFPLSLAPAIVYTLLLISHYCSSYN